MPVNPTRIAQLELELAEAKAELERENGKRYDIIMRDIDPEERQRIMDGLTERRERILFGLEAPDTKPGKSGGDLECPVCHKGGLTEKGLKLHNARKHKSEIGASGNMFAGTGKSGDAQR